MTATPTSAMPAAIQRIGGSPVKLINELTREGPEKIKGAAKALSV